MLPLDLFSRPQNNSYKISIIKEWIYSVLNLDDSTAVFITQIECREKNCPPAETVIALINSDKKTNKKTINKPISEIKKKDIINMFNK